MRQLRFLLFAVVLHSCSASSVNRVSPSYVQKTTAPIAAIQIIELRGGSTTTRKNLNHIHKKKQSVQPQAGTGTASISNLVFNLVKSIVGAGVLGLPAGIAAFGDSPLAVVPACFLIIAIGMLSAYGFSLVGQVCSLTGARSYRDAWAQSVSPSTAWIPATACLLVTSCTVLAYSIILADTIPQLLAAANVSVERTSTLLVTTGLVLLPLCLLKNLSSLAPFSLIGIMGMVYTGCAMAVRYFGGAYASGGELLESIAPDLQPRFVEENPQSLPQLVRNPNLVILICMLSTAFMAHYNAPKFYQELRNNTLPRYYKVVSISFAVSVSIFCAVAGLGFLTFGQASSGLILNNYSTRDALMSASRVAVALSIIFSYPLAFVGVRDGVLDLKKVPDAKRTDPFLNSLTVLLLAMVTGLALVVKDLKLILSFAGATWGNAVIYLFPTLMYYKCAKQFDLNPHMAVATGILGLLMGIIGTVMAVKSATK